MAADSFRATKYCTAELRSFDCAHWRSHTAWGYVPTIFENMGIVIRPNLHKNRWEWGGIDSVIEETEKCK